MRRSTSRRRPTPLITSACSWGLLPRRRCDKQPGIIPTGTFWDADDLSQRVRELASVAPDAARRLVDDHFGPRWRTEFLGLPAVAAFVAPPDYFRRWQGRGRLFHHRHPLVGRRDVLRMLHRFVNSLTHRVFLLPGRGGIGKTRLLCEFGKKFEKRHAKRRFIRILVEGVPLSQEALDELPLGSSVIVVDDAHRCPDLGLLLEWVQQHGQSKLLLLTRPQGVDLLSSTLTRSGFDPRELHRAEPLGSLTWEEQCDLARTALGTRQTTGLIERLARATRDCPLATVIGGQLLRDDAVRPELLERQEKFQRILMDRFRDELLGRLSDRIPADVCSRVLKLYAALAPIPAEDRTFDELVEAYLGLEPHELITMTAELEQSGLLLRRGRQLRIAPDVLADHVLHSACLTPQGKATGFALDIFRAFRDLCGSQVLCNLSELDWRVGATSEREPRLLNEIWHEIEADFMASSHRGRRHWLVALQEASYFQPGRVAALVKRAIREPAPEPEELLLPGWPGFTHQDVLDEIPELLRRASYSLTYLPVCLDLLWEIARDDSNTPHQHPERAMRVLLELARYQPGKPLKFQEEVVRAVQRWLHADDGTHSQSPLDVLVPLLEKSGRHNELCGFSCTAHSFAVRASVVRQVREDAMGILRTRLESKQRSISFKALSILCRTVYDPLPYLDGQFDEQALNQWEAEQLEILGILSDFLHKQPHALFRIHILTSVGDHVRRARSPTVRQGARQVLDLVGDDYDLNVTRLLLPRASMWDSFDEEPGTDEPDDRRARRDRGVDAPPPPNRARILAATLHRSSGSWRARPASTGSSDRRARGDSSFSRGLPTR